MSEPMKETAKKARLGRGLGSLLGGEAPQSRLSAGLSFDDDGLTSEARADGSTGVSSPAVNSAPLSVPVSTDSNLVKVEQVVTKVDIPESQRVWVLDIHKVQPNPSQPRRQFEKVALEELANSIRQKGVLQPITVRRSGDRFEIIAGERRWRAAQLAGLHEVPALIRESSDQDTLELALIENIQRADLNPMEEARAYQLLMDRFQMTQAAVAEKVGKERSTVANSLRLLGLAAPVQQMVMDGQLSMGHARALLAVGDTERQAEWARLAVQKGMSVRQVEALVKQSSSETDGALSAKTSSSSPVGGAVLAVEEELQKLLGTKVRIQYREGQGQIALHFHSAEEFNGIVDIIRLTWQK